MSSFLVAVVLLPEHCLGRSSHDDKNTTKCRLSRLLGEPFSFESKFVVFQNPMDSVTPLRFVQNDSPRRVILFAVAGSMNTPNMTSLQQNSSVLSR
jgi:hypothetical protein